MGDSGTVHALLLQEAQQEIASLRTELYNTRRTAEERRQANLQLSSRVQQLEAQVQSLDGSLGQCRAELAMLQGVDAQLAGLRETTQKLQRELEASTSARRILAGELAEERQQRQAADQAKAALESERSRLQKAKAELAAQLRLAEKAARDAEAEQLHAEAEAQALRQEVSMLRSGSVGSPGRFEMRASADSQTSELLLELENERHRSAALIDSLHAAREELEALQAQAAGSTADRISEQLAAVQAEAASARVQVQQLEQQLQASAAELASARQATAAAQACAEEARRAAHSAAPQVAAATTSASETSQPPAGTPSSQPLRLLSREQQPVSSSDSLYALGGTAAGTSEVSRTGEAELLAQLDRYQAQIVKLKHSRDKLLEEIDSQWEEMDRLASEHRAAMAETTTQRQLACTWEMQAQDALSQVNRLKELLEESAAWGGGAGPAGEGLGGKSAAEVAVVLQTQLLREKARAAEAELGARALAAELVRAQHASVSIGRSVLPVLCGIEHRLGGMCDEAQDALQHWRQHRAQQPGAVGPS